MSEVFVPCVDVGLGTGTAKVRDAVRRKTVTVRTTTVTLVNRVACVRGESLDRDGPHHRVMFPDGTVIWAAVMSDGPTPEAAA